MDDPSRRADHCPCGFTWLSAAPAQGRAQKLSGAVTVRANWRAIFRFDGAAEDVDYVNYH